MIFAYIDPAIGSMLLQAMVGVIFAAMVFGRRILVAPLKWLHLNRQARDDNSTESSVENNPPTAH